jgi:hypothetical protein
MKGYKIVVIKHKFLRQEDSKENGWRIWNKANTKKEKPSILGDQETLIKIKTGFYLILQAGCYRLR